MRHTQKETNMPVREWEHWYQDLSYGILMQQRAKRQAPEMEQCKQLTRLFRPYYRPGIRVVDVGCGAGHFFPSLLTAGPDLTYLGIDITAPYIKLAGETFAHDPRAQFMVGDIFRLALPDNAFDVGLCYMVLPFLPDFKDAIREVMRVVRKQAFFRLMLSDHTYIIQRFKKDCNQEASPESFVYYNIYDKDEFISHLYSIGVKEVNIYKDEFNLQLEKKDGWSTYTYGDLQISGNIVMTWNVVQVSK
jgi:ubiquinone/menaquinone biosynthesis C-methylase UbiE